MDLALDGDQQQLVDLFAGFLAKECPTSRVRAAEPLGFDAGLWAAIGALGGPTMAVPVDAGGSGASLLDAALVCEQLGAALAPVPFVESTVAARLLARLDQPLGALLDDPPAVATIALQTLQTREPAVELRQQTPRSAAGSLELVPAGAVASLLVGLVDGDVVLVDEAGPGAAPPNLGASPIAVRSLAGDRVIAPDASDAFGVAVDEWFTLTAALLAGLATEALRLGVEYAKDRHQFGVPIGSFQALAHGLADAATAVDGARLLAREAAWADGSVDGLPLMAYLCAGRAAQQAAAVSLHVHGGYGFSEEYDIQLHYRRAKAWSVAAGDPRRLAARLGRTLVVR